MIALEASAARASVVSSDGSCSLLLEQSNVVASVAKHYYLDLVGEPADYLAAAN